jgi:hypothetical protein
MEKLTIQIGGYTYVLSISPFESNIDIDSLINTDYANILGEILTFPVLLNKLGLMKADCDNILAEEKFDMEVFEAQKWEEHRKRIAGGGEKATEKIVENAVLMDQEFILKKKKFFKMQKQADYFNSIYWAAKDKSDKLNRLTDKLRPSEFEMELLGDSINGVMIKKVKNRF